MWHSTHSFCAEFLLAGSCIVEARQHSESQQQRVACQQAAHLSFRRGRSSVSSLVEFCSEILSPNKEEMQLTLSAEETTVGKSDVYLSVLEIWSDSHMSVQISSPCPRWKCKCCATFAVSPLRPQKGILQVCRKLSASASCGAGCHKMHVCLPACPGWLGARALPGPLTVWKARQVSTRAEGKSTTSEKCNLWAKDKMWHEGKRGHFSEFLVQYLLLSSKKGADVTIPCNNLCCWGDTKRQSTVVKLFPFCTSPELQK